MFNQQRGAPTPNGVGSGNGLSLSATQQSGLQQNQTNFQSPAAGMSGGTVANNGGSIPVNDGGVGLANSLNSLFGSFNSPGGFSMQGLTTGLGNLLNTYDQAQINAANQLYYDPQGINQQVQGSIDAAGLGQSPLGVGLNNLAQTRYDTAVQNNLARTNAGMLGGIGGGFMSLLMPAAQAAANEQYDQFLWGSGKQQAAYNQILADQALQAQKNAYVGMASLPGQMPGGVVPGAGPGGVSIGSASLGGSVPGTPGMQGMGPYLNDLMTGAYGNQSSPYGTQSSYGSNAGYYDQVNQDWAAQLQANQQSNYPYSSGGVSYDAYGNPVSVDYQGGGYSGLSDPYTPSFTGQSVGIGDGTDFSTNFYGSGGY